MAKPFEFGCGSVVQLEPSVGGPFRTSVLQTPSTKASEEIMLYDLHFRITEYILFDAYVTENNVQCCINDI